MKIYTFTSQTCKESWPTPVHWCIACEQGKPCNRVVERMTTDPECPRHALTDDAPRQARARVVYRSPGTVTWYESCLSREFYSLADLWVRSFDTDEDAHAWLLEEHGE